MAGVKLVVMYPRPKDVDAFEKVQQAEHVPMAVEELKGKTKFVATKVTGSPQGLLRSIASRKSTSLPWTRCRLAPLQKAVKKRLDTL